MKRIALFAVCALLAGCPDKKNDATPASASASASASAAPASASASAAPAASASALAAASPDDVDDSELDFAVDDEEVEQATTTLISKTNYKSELDKLEKEDLKK
jgi:hypothetical protein